MAHLMISAAHKSSGKTTISIGLCAALRARGYDVQPFKKGPDYIDPLWLGQAAGRSCYNLDFFTMGREEIPRLFRQRMVGADIGIIEGNKGLYDGLDLNGSNSNAALAALLQAPVVLVLDTRGMTRGIAPLILGYQAFDENIRIAGVVLNSVGGSRHETKLRNVIEHYTEVKVIGAVPRNDVVQIDERHLGLMPSNETKAAQQRIDAIADHVGSNVDLQALMDIASLAPDVSPEKAPEGGQASPDEVSIVYARDAAFGFYYPDDLQALENAGARLIPIDTLNDVAMPIADGLFIGGGFPETAMDALQANSSLRRSIRDFIEQGGPAYAECGGLMYLCRSLQWNEKSSQMVGVIPADVKMHQKPQGRGYVRLCETSHHPWPAEKSFSPQVNAHEFHYSGLESLDATLKFAYKVERGFGVDGVHDGLVYKNLLANYSHMRNVGSNHWAERFVAHVRACKHSKKTKRT
ncbi:MAG TPA: hydrogenobyrinic acid a,c-diamide synthase (glutamine-hydrolyzing) [Thiolapillus brandeum]|uniref:Cobyrinate a,c-diamide synthase n=1 Tax=Thiolapillus brandeum TaxID=1076588 RepID=A0A831K832_9GAMM|nr:hydrogenobyrinic acid a,c-diamide synthase (glutamine-hydrolyzing) [Thiolapillus brandeum]